MFFMRNVLRLTFAISMLSAPFLSAQDQLKFYFNGGTANVGQPASYAFDASGNFWTMGQQSGGGLKYISGSGGSWTSNSRVTSLDYFYFMRSNNVNAGTVDQTWGGPGFGSPNGMLLNPAPLTITIPTGMGGTVTKTYQAGELLFISDATGENFDNTGTDRFETTKKIFRYDLRTIDSATTAQPDFNNADFDANPGTPPFGAFGKADWNDVFQPVASELDIRNAGGGSLTGSDNFGRQFGWSSDGHFIYAIEAGAVAGIYKIDARTTGSVVRLWDETPNNFPGTSITSEPAVMPTSLRDFATSNPAVGDQIITEGSAAGGNEGGLVVYTDTGSGPVSAPDVIFTEAQFRSFAEYVGTGSPQYNSLTRDAAGNLYFSEQQTRGVYKLDTQNRLSKVMSETEMNLFQIANSSTPTDITIRLQARTSTTPGGFGVTEVVYRDDAIDGPVGIYDYKVGDFNRDNSVNSADLALFSAALGLRGAPATDANQKFDLNGNPNINTSTGNHYAYPPPAGSPPLAGNSVVDWKDVKILQQFANIPNGDVNFDSALNFTDLDVMSANYYTLAGQTAETWATGDIASVDPNYAATAVDANIVNLVDLNLTAQTWVQVLGQAPVTMSQATMRGYTGQFLTDLLAAFAAAGSVPGDYNANGIVDAADYTIWRDTQGATGSGLAADGNGDLVVNGLDYTYWQTRFGNTMATVSAAASSAAVPEPSTLLYALVGCGLLSWRRSRR
jgi:hypothetical protein